MPLEVTVLPEVCDKSLGAEVAASAMSTEMLNGLEDFKVAPLTVCAPPMIAVPVKLAAT